MNISSATAAPRPTYAQAMQARAETRQAADARKRLIQSEAMEARSSPRMDAAESRKRRAKEKLVEIGKRLKLLQKLFAHNPKGMAKALAQVFKELKAAVKDYKDAGGQEMAMTGEAVTTALANNAPEPGEDDAEKEAPAAEAESAESAVEAEAQAESAEAQAAPEELPLLGKTPAEGSAIYDAVVNEVRKSIGEDGLDFAKTVREALNLIKQRFLEPARTQALGRKPDKDTEKAFEEADKEFKETMKEVEDMVSDIRRDVPDAGMKLSMAA